MKKKIPFFFFFLMLIFIAYLYANTGGEKTTAPKKKIVQKEVKPKEIKKVKQQQVELPLADKIITIAKSKEGITYRAGGTTDKGYDCSGLVMTSFAKQGVQLPRSSFEMSKEGKEIRLEDVKKGDLVFFTTNPSKPGRINHVGLVTSVEDGVVYFIHSTFKKGVIISNTEEKYYKNSFFKAKRVL